jgi:hypothetical protein
MRELTSPSLFDVPAAGALQPTPEAPPREESRAENLAKDFVRWCFSFGRDFRNSPDLINIRIWAQKTRLKLADAEETQLLLAARRLYTKRIEQMMKKVEAPVLG